MTASSESVDRLMLPGVGETEWTFIVEIEEESWSTTSPATYSWTSGNPTYTLEWVVRAVFKRGEGTSVERLEMVEELYVGFNTLILRVGGDGLTSLQSKPFTMTTENPSAVTFEERGRHRCRDEASATQVMTALAVMKRMVLDAQR